METSQCFARKLLRTFMDEETIANEARAITILCRNSHVNIIHVFEHGYLNAASYFIDMELCELNLDEYIRGRKTGVYGLLDWAEAAKQGYTIFLTVAIMQQLLSGLIFIHHHREVHRDLDPKNVHSGWWKIADFGLTSGGTTSRLQNTHEAKGKPCYRPPELLQSPGGYNNKTDIWGLGCILFELCVGEKAFQSDWDTYAYAASNPSEHPRINFPDHMGHNGASKRTFRVWINEMLQVDHQDRPSAATWSQRFEELLSLLNPPSPKRTASWMRSDQSQFCTQEYLLGTDLPTFQPPFRWEKILPGSNVEQNLQFLQRWRTLVSARELLLGEEDPHTVWSIVCLAWTCFYVGPGDDAEVLFKKAVKSQIELNGLEHEETLSVLKGQAWATGNLGRHKQASHLCKRFLKLSCKVLGQDHPETFSGMTGLARTNLYQRKLGQAINLLKIALSGQQKSEHRGPEHPETVECMSLLAAAYYQHGDIQKASDIYKDASEIQRRILGVDNPDTLVNMSGLAWTHIRLGQPQDAVEILERRGVLAKQTRMLGLDHLETIASSEGLAQAYEDLGDNEKAMRLRETNTVRET